VATLDVRSKFSYWTATAAVAVRVQYFREEGRSAPSSLIFRSRKGEFESRVKPELPVLYRVARRFVASQEEAEDLVQQTLLQAMRAWHDFDGQHLRSWLIKIMRNEAAAWSRKASSKVELLELREELEPSEEIWDALVWRDQTNRILCELNRLPIEYKLAVHLCDVEEMTYEEAAHALDVPIGTIRSRLYRGRSMIRARLMEDER
jgi:RNA polymerase sigma-70 factor, ECF subfamily